MTTQESLAVVKGVYEAFNRGDIRAMVEMMTEDVDWTFPGIRVPSPYAGQFKGRVAVGKFFESLAANEDLQAFEVREFIAEGDSVVALGYYRSRIKATGRTLEGEWAQVFRMRNGKVVSSRYYVDTAAVEAAYRTA
jgi:uncharacterized protein